jgi:antitoxin MazE
MCIFNVDTFGGEIMQVNVQKWGNSLAVRIPKAFAEEIGLEENSSVRLTLKEGGLLITPDEGAKWVLADLLLRVTEDNKPREWETGAAEGAER